MDSLVAISTVRSEFSDNILNAVNDFSAKFTGRNFFSGNYMLEMNFLMALSTIRNKFCDKIK